mgnify:CR=1 FL=1
MITNSKYVTLLERREANVLASVPWVAQWKFNNDGQDSVGANHLTNNNSATFTTGKLGGALGATQLVAASSQYWSIADNAALSMGDVDCTFCGWFYLDSVSDAAERYILQKGTSPNFEYGISIESLTPNIYFRFWVSNDGGSVGANNENIESVLVLSQWICFFCWHDSVANTINYQLNDGTVRSVSYAGGMVDRAGSLTIGSFGIIRFMDGRIDNVCIAKSAAGGGGVLTAAQRTAFYNAGVGTEVLT